MSLPARLAIFALFVSAIFVSAPAEDSRAATSARIHFFVLRTFAQLSEGRRDPLD